MPRRTTQRGTRLGQEAEGGGRKLYRGFCGRERVRQGRGFGIGWAQAGSGSDGGPRLCGPCIQVVSVPSIVSGSEREAVRGAQVVCTLDGPSRV